MLKPINAVLLVVLASTNAFAESRYDSCLHARQDSNRTCNRDGSFIELIEGAENKHVMGVVNVFEPDGKKLLSTFSVPSYQDEDLVLSPEMGKSDLTSEEGLDPRLKELAIIDIDEDGYSDVYTTDVCGMVNCSGRFYRFNPASKRFYLFFEGGTDAKRVGGHLVTSG